MLTALNDSEADRPAEGRPLDDAPQPRLVITKMALTNFKSYAGRQEVGPFHKSFSAVIGPNGSGKSNVIDALLFVFGYRASKMRQGKLSELIHTSQKYPSLDSCTVEVYFNTIIDLPGQDAFEVVSNSDLVVSRSAYRNNTSRYFINNNPSNYTAVTTLLRHRGIDLDHKRFLILQGEVESISQMKPKAQNEHEDGLLEYLEDIIGTSKYKSEIEEHSKELEKLNEERGGKLDRVKIVEKEKQSLESKKKDAVDYLRSENKLVEKKSAYYQCMGMTCEELARKAAAGTEEFKAKLKREHEKHAGIRKEVDELQAQQAHCMKEFEVIGKTMNATVREVALFDSEDAKLQERKKHVKSKLKKLTTQMGKENQRLSENKTWIRNYEDDLDKHQRELQEQTVLLEQEEKQLTIITDELKGKTEVFSAQIEEKQKDLAPWTQKINERKSLIDVAQSEYDLLYEKATAGQRAVAEVEEQIKTLKQEHEEKCKALRTMLADKAEIQKEIQKTSQLIAAAGDKETKLRSIVSDARQKAEEAKMSLHTAQSRGTVLSALLKMRDSGRIRGIYGRLGDLGVIDKPYEIAISTACSQLDNIVVDNVETGQACIEYLRRNNLGRASFLLLEQLPKYEMRPIQTPEGVPRLFDLVKPREPKLAVPFYHVLRDTLVAEDLQQANRIAYGRQRWRVVTKTGELIDKSGTMTGGGARPKNGAMKSQFADDGVGPEKLATLEREREAAEMEMTAFREELQRAEEAFDRLQRQLSESEVAISKLEMGVRAIEKQIPDVETQIARIRRENQPDVREAARMKQLEQEIRAHEKELKLLQNSCAAIEEAIKVLRNKILEAGGTRLRMQKSKVEGIVDQIDLLNEQVTKTQAAKAKAEKDVVKGLASIGNGERELTELKEQLEEVEQKIGELTSAAVEVRERCEKAKKEQAEKQEEIDDLNRLREEKAVIIGAIRKTEATIEMQLEEFKMQLNENTKKNKHWNQKRLELRLQEIDDPDCAEDPKELQDFTVEVLQTMDVTELKESIALLEAKLKAAKPNLTVIDEYKQRLVEYQERIADLHEITARRDAVKKQYDELRKRRLDEFMEGFTTISQKLKEMYQMITLGGNAELELVDSLDPFSEGIVFSVMPPKKSWKNISNLSGGEKTLSSLALVFALHHFKPTPLYVMDEIDAALDFRNVSIVANYIKDRTKNAQFIIISLRCNLFELADLLVGIYKTDNQTKSVTIKPANVMALAG